MICLWALMTFENNADDSSGRYYLIGAAVFDSERNVVLRDGDIVRLEPKVAALLTCFIDSPGRVHSKDELIAQVWAGVTVVEEVLPRAISLLRSALGDDARHPTFIETVPNKGYRFIPRPQLVTAPVASSQTRGKMAFIRLPTVLAFALGALLASLAFLLWAPHDSAAPLASSGDERPPAAAPQPSQ